jgi:hypothetical protein
MKRRTEGLGVLLIAVQRPFYGRLAYNMALSLKLDQPDLPILLLADEPALAGLDERQCRVFDERRAPDPADYLSAAGANPFRLKTRMYDYTPFETTLYLDADGLFFNAYRDFDDLRRELDGCAFQIQEEFRYGSRHRGGPVQYPWADLDEAWTVHGLAEDASFVDYNSSFVWFSRSEANRRYFETVKSLYDEPRIRVHSIGGRYAPDELAFSLASATLGHESCRPDDRPIFLQCYSERHPRREGARTFPELASDDEVRDVVRQHHFLGLPAIPPTAWVIALYNHLVRLNARQAGDEEAFTYDWRKKLVTTAAGLASEADEVERPVAGAPHRDDRRAQSR